MLHLFHRLTRADTTVITLFVAVLMSACSSGESPTPIVSCEPRDGMTPDCRFQNPEDIALLPGSGSVVVSQFGAMDGSKPGSIATYSLDSEEINVVFPVEHDDDRRWGSETCGPPDQATFAPHGLDLQQRSDGRWMLLVVNHGSRESIEFFEIVGAPDDIALAWRGCAEGPESAYFNDVVATTDGSFWVTHMMPKDSQTWATVKALLGANSGFVYRWDRADGFVKVAGSDGPMPNGIEKSEDGTTLFINMYLAGEVRKLDLASGEVIGITEAPGPDNVTWSDDGSYLLVASHTDGMGELMACQEIEEGACGFGYEIVRINPADMSRSTLIEHRGPPLGGVTVATDLGDELMLGTFAGDRIVRVKDPGAGREEQ